jgi:hypothetical protein
VSNYGAPGPYKITRVGGDPDNQPLSINTVPAATTPQQYPTDSPWIGPERFLEAVHKLNGWPPGQYRIEGDFADVTRTLPLGAAYAALPSSSERDNPSRKYCHCLAGFYPPTTAEQVAEQYDVFRAHFRGEISDEELLKRTGYERTGKRHYSTYGK